MKYSNEKTHFILSLLALALVSSCQNNDELSTESVMKNEVHNKIVNVTHHDGRPFSTGVRSGSAQAKFVSGPGGGVMMQGFYWDVPDGGNWWNTVKDKLTAWSNAGVGAVWLPQLQKRRMELIPWDMIPLIIMILEILTRMEV